MTDRNRNTIRRAIGGVLFNVSNFPEQARPYLAGQNMGPLNEKITDAVLAAIPAHTPTDDERDERFVTDADLDRFEATATPIYRSTFEAERASKFLVSDLGQWIIRLVAEVRRLRRSEVPEPSGPWDRTLSCFGHCDKEGWYSECVSKKADAELAQPQGEPSDAQADEAQRGYHAFAFGPEEVDAFLTPERLAKGRDAWKAALRAAGGVK